MLVHYCTNFECSKCFGKTPTKKQRSGLRPRTICFSRVCEMSGGEHISIKKIVIAEKNARFVGPANLISEMKSTN